ncbi:uncharacterized protein KQ657_002720 [Scheffersomyces spartinae]|uniref:Uncharacterized protein n=1 Tax=Scheffersomyces spartinae TaxID=45513 RepID=A0A9P7V5U5_9ASCO|nr:uncharacterized protein KQ657_002720 [Scheffersomyces spartinae]KAG7191758.1 hypothetical protein KQ657_002720 [Scheffersomyces spartinae]
MTRIEDLERPFQQVMSSFKLPDDFVMLTDSSTYVPWRRSLEKALRSKTASRSLVAFIVAGTIPDFPDDLTIVEKDKVFETLEHITHHIFISTLSDPICQSLTLHSVTTFTAANKYITEKYGFPTVSHLINFYDSLHKTEDYALTYLETTRIQECYSPAELSAIYLLLAQPTSIRHAFDSRVQTLPPTIVDGVPRRTLLAFDLFQSVCASEAMREPKVSTPEITLATFNNRRPFRAGTKRRFSSRKFICYNWGKPGHGISEYQQPLQKPFLGTYVTLSAVRHVPAATTNLVLLSAFSVDHEISSVKEVVSSEGTPGKQLNTIADQAIVLGQIQVQLYEIKQVSKSKHKFTSEISPTPVVEEVMTSDSVNNFTEGNTKGAIGPQSQTIGNFSGKEIFDQLNYNEKKEAGFVEVLCEKHVGSYKTQLCNLLDANK